MFSAMLLQILPFVAFVCANLPPVPGTPVYYNSTGLSISLPGPTFAPSGTILRRGLTAATGTSANASIPIHTRPTNSISSGVSGGSIQPSISASLSNHPTLSGTRAASTGKPSHVSGTSKYTAPSTGKIYRKRTFPTSNSTLASTGVLPTSVKRTEISTGYTYTKSSVSASISISTNASTTSSSSITTTRTLSSSGITSSQSGYPTSGTWNTTLTTAISRSSSLHSTASSVGSLSISKSTPPPPFPSNTTSTSIFPTTTSTPDLDTFRLQVFVTFNDISSPFLSGSYLAIHPDENSQGALQLVPEFSDASLFTLSPAGNLLSGDKIADMPAGDVFGRLMMQTEAEILAGGFERTVCENVGGVLSCSSEDDATFAACEPIPNAFVEVGPTGGGEIEGCAEFILLVVWGR